MTVGPVGRLPLQLDGVEVGSFYRLPGAFGLGLDELITSTLAPSFEEGYV